MSKNLFSELDWPNVLRRASLLAALALLAVSYFGFNSGLGFKGGLLVSSMIWFGFTIIQFIGNYTENQTDWVFFMVWLFTYLVGIGAGAWAAYGWIDVENEWIRWVCAFGLGGAAELVPERLFSMFVTSMKPSGYRAPRPAVTQSSQPTRTSSLFDEHQSAPKPVSKDIQNSRSGGFTPRPERPTPPKEGSRDTSSVARSEEYFRGLH